jgi:hypothetical protein
MNAPDIARLVERYTDHPPLAPGTQRHTVGDAGGNAFTARQVVQGDCQTGFQGARQPHAAALRIEHESVSGFGEWSCGIQTGDAKRNLGADASAAPSRVKQFLCGVHSESFHLILRSSGDFSRGIVGRDAHQSNLIEPYESVVKPFFRPFGA